MKTHAEVASHMGGMFHYTRGLFVLKMNPFQQRVLKGKPVVRCWLDGDDDFITRCKANVTMVRYNHIEYVSSAPNNESSVIA